MPERRTSLKILFVAAVCDRQFLQTATSDAHRAPLQLKFEGNFVIAFERATIKLRGSIWSEKYER
jgi:hypothetical protein